MLPRIGTVSSHPAARCSGSRRPDRGAVRCTESRHAEPAMQPAGFWTAAAPLPVPEVSQAALLLANGDVLMTGGEDVKDGRPTSRGAAISHCRGNVVDRGRDAARAHRPHGDPARGRPCSCRGRSGEEAAAAQFGRDLRPGSRPMGFDGATTGRSVFALRHASSRRPRPGGGRDRPWRDLPQCSHLRSAQAGMASGAADARSACAAGRADSSRRASSDRRWVRRQGRGLRPESRQVDEGGRS